MTKNIFVIVGSAGENSSNLKLVNRMAALTASDFDMMVYGSLKQLPHFDPELSMNNPPQIVLDFRSAIEKADGILICTPEYIFSIPAILKNAIEWCVSTTVFSKKPVGLITASADGRKGHEQLQLIMKTVEATLSEETSLLIPGIRGKIDQDGNIKDPAIAENLANFTNAFKQMLSPDRAD
jgi:chromate reductase, NAD(P)H dehydrogenase (quinone)